MSTPDTTTHANAPTQYLESGTANYAYRRFGQTKDLPVLCLQHFRGHMDDWDPEFTDGVAAQREVILVNYPGVSSSTGEPGRSITEMAHQIITFVDGLGLERLDLLGFSIGGFVAQEIALIRPALVHKLILAGTGPKGAPLMHGWRQDIEDNARAAKSGDAEHLYIFFAHSDNGQALGRKSLARQQARTENRDPRSGLAARDAQYDAIVEWGIPDHAALQRLTGIKNPTLIIQGDDDLMIPTKGSYTMAGLIPDATIKIIPDAAHASLFQYPAEAACEVNTFLS
jgi:pimeloyl-ACP methyl ester carboxylesterase